MLKEKKVWNIYRQLSKKVILAITGKSKDISIHIVILYYISHDAKSSPPKTLISSCCKVSLSPSPSVYVCGE